MGKYLLNKNTIAIFYLICISFFASLYYSQNPFSAYYDRTDGTVYQYVANYILHGKMIYRDIFDHKGPYTYLWNVLGFSIHPILGQWFLETLLLFISAIFSYLIGKQFLPFYQALLLTTIFILNPLEDTIGNTENIANSVTYFSIWLFTKQINTPTIDKKHSIIFGILSGVILFSKPNEAIVPCIIFLSIILTNIKQKQKIIYFIKYSAISGVLTLLLPLLWLYFTNSIQDFYKDFFEFNMDYSAMNKPTLQDIVLPALKNKIAQFGLFATIINFVFIKFFTKKEIKIIITCTIAFIFSTIASNMSGRNFTHYFYIIYPSVSILAIFPLKLLNIKTKIYISLILLLLAIHSASFLSLHIKTSTKGRTETKIISFYINKNIPKEKKIVILGWDMNRVSLYSNTFTDNKYVQSAIHEKLYPKFYYSELRKYDPDIIVLFSNIFSHISHDNHKTRIREYYPEIDTYKEIYQYGNYQILSK